MPPAPPADVVTWPFVFAFSVLLLIAIAAVRDFVTTVRAAQREITTDIGQLHDRVTVLEITNGVRIDKRSRPIRADASPDEATS